MHFKENKLAESKKIIPYKKRRDLNVGIIIFLVISLYIFVNVVRGYTKRQVRYYEIVEGSMSEDKTHTGLILRDESVQAAPSTGYINTYMRDGKRYISVVLKAQNKAGLYDNMSKLLLKID